MPLIIFALIIDGLQAGISAGLIGMGTVVSWIPILGQLGYGATFGLALVINTCLSLGLGSALVMLAITMGYRPWRLFPAFLEVIPGINMFPSWTGAVLYCVLKQEGTKKTSGIISNTFSIADTFSPQGQTAARLERASGSFSRQSNMDLNEEFNEREKSSRPQLVLPQRNLDGIRNTVQKSAVLVLFFLLSFPHIITAQGVEPVQFIVSPEVPGPNQNVTIQIQGVGTFLGEAQITWQKDGQAVLQGTGERSYSFTAGNLGVQTRVNVVINSSTHGRIERNFNFIPSVVNLVWEAETFVPAVYRGKALYSAGSGLKVTAFPSIVSNGSTISSNNLSFQWERNGDPIPAASGLGRNTFSFTGDQLRTNENVGVVVYLGGVKVGQSRITIPATEPQIVFYPRNPLRGPLYENALPNSISLASNEITLQAVAYFFSKQSIANNLAYTWKINGRETTGPDADRGLLTLRQSGTAPGQASLTLALQNTDTSRFVQSAQAALQIAFGGQSSESVSPFGL